MIMIIANNCVQYTDITTYLSLCLSVYVCLNNTSLCCGKFSLTTWHVLAEEGGEGRGAVFVMVTLKINTHVCLGHLFCQTATRQRRFTFTHTHTYRCRADEMSECKRAKKISLLCAVCLWECGWSLSHSLSPTALANNEMYSNSPTQSIGLFVLHVCYSRSPFLLLILIQRFVQIAAKLLLCLSIFLILSQPAASTHKIQKKEAKKKRRKTNTL